MHEENCFVTLTYNDENLPENSSLQQGVVSEWIKRVRFHISPKRIRYFYVGEYGEASLRPHYHVSLFGVSRLSVFKSGPVFKTFDEIANRSWHNDKGASRGFVQVAEFNELTAQYVSGYVIKKLGDMQDDRLVGRYPEFAVMSRRPGIGATAIPTLAKALQPHVKVPEDVPRQLKLGTRNIPVGRYLRQKLLEELGFTEEQISASKQAVTHETSLQLSALFLSELANEESISRRDTYNRSVKQRIAQAETRAKIWSKKGSI